MTEKTTTERLDELIVARRRMDEAHERMMAVKDERIRARYAARRAEDKAAGRDVSGKSVATRRMMAYGDVVGVNGSGDEAFEAARAEFYAAEAAYEAARF